METDFLENYNELVIFVSLLWIIILFRHVNTALPISMK